MVCPEPAIYDERSQRWPQGWLGRAGGWVTLTGTKKAVSPYPAQATLGAFFRKEVAPDVARWSEQQGHSGTLPPPMKDSLRAHRSPSAYWALSLQRQVIPVIAFYSFQDIVEVGLPVWVT